MDRKKEITDVMKRLSKEFPDCRSDVMLWAERRESPWKVLVGTILSQRTRDEATEIAAYRLFSKYNSLQKLAKAPIKSIEKLIKIAGPYHQKAKYIKDTAKILVKDYKGKVPKTFEELTGLPGVGHKTADCTLLYGHGILKIPVDVHVDRISNMFGWVNTKNPEKTRGELQKIVPKRYWSVYNCLFVTLGQKTMYKDDLMRKYLGEKLYKIFSKRKSFTKKVK